MAEDKPDVLQGTLALLVLRTLSENNRKAKYYAITRAGQKRLAVEEENWKRVTTIVGRFLKLSGDTP